MAKNDIFTELDDIHYKYQRLGSLIGIMQMFVSEVVEIAGAPADCLNDALFEIESEMDKTNERLGTLLKQKGGAV